MAGYGGILVNYASIITYLCPCRSKLGLDHLR